MILPGRLRFITALAAGLVASASLAALAGWTLGLVPLQSLLLPARPIGSVSCVCFCFAGGAIILLNTKGGRAGQLAAWIASVFIAAAVCTAASGEIFQITQGPLGRLIAWMGCAAPAPGSASAIPLSINAFFPFLLLSLGVFSLRRRRRSLFDVTFWAGVSVSSFALHVLMSYPLLLSAVRDGRMGPLTAFFLFLLGLGLAASGLESPQLAIFRKDNPVGFVTLRLFLATLVFPPLLLTFEVWWLRRSASSGAHQTVFFSALAAVAFLALLTIILRRLEILDQHRSDAEQARSEILARLQQQAATLQFEVSERTFELRESSERLELALESSGCGVWYWDPATDRATWNDRMCAIYGLPPGGYDGTHKSWISMVHPDERAQVEQEAARELQSGTHFDKRFRILGADGNMRHIESKGLIHRDGSGRCIRMVGVDRDVTAERDSALAQKSLAERLQFALASAGYGVWELDCASETLSWDDRMLAVYGIRRQDFQGRGSDWLNALHPEDRAASAPGTREIREGRAETYNDRFRIVRPDGVVRNIEARGFLQRGADGRPLRIIGLNRDVTAETELREQLRIAEERWQLALWGNNDGLWDWNISTNELYHDARYAEMIGYSRGEIPFHYAEWEKRVHPEDLRQANEALKAHLSGQTPFYAAEYRLQHKDGHWVWILDRGKIVSRDSSGHPVRAVGTHTDISVSKALESRLREFEEMALQMGRLAQIGPWEWNSGSGKLTWSPEVHRIHHTDLGFEPTVEQMLNFYPDGEREKLRASLDDALRDGTPFDLELQMQTAQKEQRWVRILGQSESRNQRGPRIYGAVQDITQFRNSEMARRQLETQLFQAQKLETLGTLAGGIAHDFNNLLTGILGYQELALDGLGPDDPARSCLEAARGVSMRARGLVEQILTLSRRPTNDTATVDLAYVIEEAQRFLRTTVGPNIAIETNIEEHCPHAYAEATQIHQVLLNLGQNAAHAIGTSPGTIRISLSSVEMTISEAESLGLSNGGPFILLKIKDTGHGMDSETQKRIFDPFFTTKGVGKGTGLGLSVVHGIVRAHRGAVSVESSPGNGATFCIYLRCALESTEALPSDEKPAPHGSGELVCVVDDEDFVLSCVSKAVEKLGYRSRSFDSPEKCLETLREEHATCALLVTDQTMPGMTGTELAERARSFAPDLPIIIMSGYFSKISPSILEKMDRVSLVSKPFTATELAQAVYRSLHPDI